MSGTEVDLQQVKQLVKLVEKYGLAELAVEEEGLSIVVKGVSATVQTPPAAGQPISVDAAAAPVYEEPVEPETEEEELENLLTIASPMVGVFYRSPSPEQPQFVDVGDQVEIGQTIGLIEAMKVFSEIPSEVAGVVVEVPAPNGKLVHAGDPLVRLRPL